MRPPFPGMDPWLEHTALWPDVQNSLVVAMSDAIVPFVAPKYYVGLGRRVYRLKPDDLVSVGCPDVALVTTEPAWSARSLASESGGVAVLDGDKSMTAEVDENYLEVREVETGNLVTILELLSPANKQSTKGRAGYLQKRSQILRTRTNLVEVDLLRAGEPMPVVPLREAPGRDYRILVSRGNRRPKSRLYAFGVRQAIPVIDVPLLPGDAEPPLDLGTILHALYDRARFDLRLNYTKPPVPPLDEADAAWAREIVESGRQPR